MGAGTGIPLSLPESAIKGTALSGAPMTPIAAHTKNLFGVLPSCKFITYVKTESISGEVIHPIGPLMYQQLLPICIQMAFLKVAYESTQSLYKPKEMTDGSKTALHPIPS